MSLRHGGGLRGIGRGALERRGAERSAAQGEGKDFEENSRLFIGFFITFDDN